MSFAGEKDRPEQERDAELVASGRVEPVEERFKVALDLGENKPDFPALGSPVSPLRFRSASQGSSCSSSSGSASGKAVTSPAGIAAAVWKSDTGAADSGRRSHSGELFGQTSPTTAEVRDPRTAVHRRSGSGPQIYSCISGSISSGDANGGGGGGGGGTSTASSPITNVLPAGNICPSGKIGKTGMMQRASPRSDVLRSGAGNYGHGSVVRGGLSGVAAARPNGDVGTGNLGISSSRRSSGRMDPEEVTRAGNEHYKKGQYGEALACYDRAVAMCPENATCRSNRAASLLALGRLEEARRECEEAVRLDAMNGRAHHRLASVNIRLGLVEDARKHLSLTGHTTDQVELQILQELERHLVRCGEARKIGDWKTALKEAEAAIAAGADSSLLLVASRAEALLHLHQLDEADSIFARSKFEDSITSYSATKIFGMLSYSYFHIVRAQVDMALGRFENAVVAAEKAWQVDARNMEVIKILNNVKSVARARAHGNELFKSGNFAGACTAYGEGIRCNPSNPVLLCNRAACRSKLGQYIKSLEDCNEALRIQPNYTKALLRRADSYAKLERWADAIRDYGALRKELPGDKEVAEALFHSQIALKMSRGEEISNLKFGGEVEEVSSMEQYQAAVTLPGASVVYFMSAMNPQCDQMSPFVDGLCSRYPSANFLKVDINRSPVVATTHNIRIVPTFKIYKNGASMKEMICPSQHMLESSVSHYSI